MPRNVYSEINLHITWHTKKNLPVIRNRLEDRLHHFLRARVCQTPGASVHEVGGVEDHIHLAVSVPPTLCVSRWIGELKGASSHHINKQVVRRRILAWQTGYGVVSFGTKDLPYVVEYIRTQKERHAKGWIHDRLERTNRGDNPPQDKATQETQNAAPTETSEQGRLKPVGEAR